MKKTIKTKIVCMCLILAMLVSFVPLTVFADEENGDIEFGDTPEEDVPGEDGEGEEDEKTEIDYSTAVPVVSADELEAAVNSGTQIIRIAADFEIDRTIRNNQKHEEIIKKNDPNSVFHKKLL
jgi:hypothetical protein